MNLQTPVHLPWPANWPLAAIAILSLSILLAGLLFRPAIHSANPPAQSRQSTLSSQPGVHPQIMPVSTPWLSTQTPGVSATSFAAEARPVPVPWPVPTPPVEK